MGGHVRDIAGRVVVAGDVVGYAATSYSNTRTSLYIVHRIDVKIEQRNHRVRHLAGPDTWQLRPTEITSVWLRGFKKTWYDEKVRTYVRQIWAPHQMVLVDNVDLLDKNDPVNSALLGWVAQIKDTPYEPFYKPDIRLFPPDTD